MIWLKSPIDDRPNTYTSAASISPSCNRTQASYSAHAPSISTCDSALGGHTPTASSAATNEKGPPIR